MKILKNLMGVLLAGLLPHLASAAIVGPYKPDANTPFLFHFNNSGSAVTNFGTVGGYAYAVTIGTGSGPSIAATNVTTLFNGTPYNATFTNALAFPSTTAGYMVGYAGTSSSFTTDTGNSGSRSPNVIAESILGIGVSANSPWTIEAMVKPTATNANQEIVCMDSYASSRGFQFKINNAGQLQFQTIGGTAFSCAIGIPSSGTNAFVSGTWYHVAVVYNGSVMQLYWTAINGSATAAIPLGAAVTPTSGSMGTAQGAITGPLVFGNKDRLPAAETFNGSIDEIRISNVARAANQMMFAPATVIINQEPVAQEGVDYGNSGVLTVGASSAATLGYQWWQNSTALAGATNATYTFTNATQANAGNYFCIITNVSGYSATSSVCSVVIGAANFLTNRYSFDVDVTDSIGGQNGSAYGGVTFNGNGTLTLDGSSGYVQLPSMMINTNMGAITLETWASFGSISANAMLFAFGDINGSAGSNYIFSTPHGSTARIAITAGSGGSEQGAVAGSALDNYSNVQIVAVFAPYAGYEALYTNGVLAAINTNLTLSLASIVDNYSYIGHSLYSADPYLACTLDEFRIYNGALSAASIQQSYLQGVSNILNDGAVSNAISPADLTVAVGQPATFSAVFSGHQPIVYQWLKNGSPIAGATNLTYSYFPAFADNGATFQILATNTVNSTKYSAASTVATLTVIVPETLAWFGASDNGWNTSSYNWSNSAHALVPYAGYDNVVFDDRGASQSTVDLQFTANPVAMLVSNSTAVSYDFVSSSQNGALQVLGTLTKKNSGTFILDVTNLSTGPTVIQGGTLQVGNGDTYGTLGSGPVTNNSALVFNRTDAFATPFTAPNDLHGTGTVTYNSGTVLLTSTNIDYTGATVINNTAILEINNGLALGKSASTTVASGGQVYINAAVNVGSNLLVLNGTGDGNGALRKSSGASGYGGPVSLASDSTIGVDSGATLALSNGISGVHALTVGSGGTLSLNAPSTYTGGTTLASGILNVNTNGALGTGAVIVSSGTSAGRIVLGAGATITNSIDIASATGVAATGFIMMNDNTNNGAATVGGPVTFDFGTPTGGHFYGPTSSGYLNVAGPVTMTAGANIVIRAGNMRFSGGGSYPRIDIRANTTSLGANNGLATNAVVDLAGNGTAYFDLNGHNQWLAGLQNTVTPSNLGWVTNSSVTQGTLTLDVGTGNSESFGGSIVGNIGLVVNSGSQTLAGNGTATSGTDTYVGNTTINPGATLVIGSGVVLTNTPNINVASNATLDISAGGLTLKSTQTITGSGTIVGSVTNGGVAPGTSTTIGNLTVNGNLVLSGLTTVKIDPNHSTNDLLSVSGNVTYGGTLYATNLGSTPNVGQTFTVVSAGTQSGGFTNVVGSPGAGRSWTFSNGVLSVLAAYPTNLTMQVSGNQMVISWPADHIGWQLQYQGLPLNAGYNPSNWVNIAGTTGVTAFTNANLKLFSGRLYRLVFNP